jgi:hypothetical protein
MRLFVRALFVIVVAFGLGMPTAAAASGPPPGQILGQMWQDVLTLPTADNPFSGGSPCLYYNGLASVFGPNTDGASCTVHQGTRLFIAGYSSECSTVEEPPYSPPGDNDNEASLRACAQAADDGFNTPTVLLDGQPVPLTRVTSPLIKAKLPSDNVFGTPVQVAYSVADGWVAETLRLPIGSHTIAVTVTGTDPFGNPVNTVAINTVIISAGNP